MSTDPSNRSRRRFIQGAGAAIALGVCSPRVLAKPVCLDRGAFADPCVEPLAGNTLTPPVIPVGLDTYRRWDQWPAQRIGARVYMRSTYDRSGGNQGSDAAHFLYMGEKSYANVVLDIAGPGELYFARANRWHGSPWHYIVDGVDYVIKETGTAGAGHKDQTNTTSHFIPRKPFPAPLAYTWPATKGSDLFWIPIGFLQSLKIAYGHTHYGTGYFIYKKYANAGRLSRAIHAWSIHDRPAQDVLDLVNRAGSDIAPKHIATRTGSVRLDRNLCRLIEIKTAPSVIRAIKIALPLAKAQALERVRLQMTWDDAATPSVDAPLCLLFAAGTFYNRDKKRYLVEGFPINVRYDYEQGWVRLACYFPMPFFKSARLDLASDRPDGATIFYEIRYEPGRGAPAQSSYFHATYRTWPAPEKNKDLVLLDTRGIEGHDLWSGSLVGTSIIFSHSAVLHTLEGDPRFFFDGSRSPQAHGTGTEEWCGGGDYWHGENVTLPFVGHPTGAQSKNRADSVADRLEAGYRFLLADAMPFGRAARIQLEHGGRDRSDQHYESVTYWYGLPSPSLIATDAVDVGRAASEHRHGYRAFASTVTPIHASDSVGTDDFSDVNGESYSSIPVDSPVFAYGRATRGGSEFTISVMPDNFGVLIRRTLDYSFPDQKAAVYVADAAGKPGLAPPEWRPAGIWYLAGSNTTVYSNPKAEKGARVFDPETASHRIKDDEFLIAEELTRGRSTLRLWFRPIPVCRGLYPGQAFPKPSAWSELYYQIYACVVPAWPVQL